MGLGESGKLYEINVLQWVISHKKALPLRCLPGRGLVWGFPALPIRVYKKSNSL